MTRPDLLLRPWDEADASSLRAAVDEDVDHLKPWLSWTLEEPATLERTRERLRRWAEEFRSGRGRRWAVVAAERPTVILGGANLNRRVGPGGRDVGYWVRKSAARGGVASAAVSALVVHAFERAEGGAADDERIHRLVARCDPDNAPSAALARSLGFRSLGPATVRWPDGSPRPVHRFEMTRDAYVLRHRDALRERARRVRLVTAPGAT